MRRKFRAEARPSEKIRRLKSALSFFVTDYGLKSVAWIVFVAP
jgi:ribosomal protein L15E